MLKLTKGHIVSKPELLEEGYMISGDVTIVANVDADKIKQVPACLTWKSGFEVF